MYIYVVDREGVEHKLDAIKGWRIMEIIRDHGLNIKAECGGSCLCATCHVYVDDEWLDKLYDMEEEEEDMLEDGAMELKDNSRLSCQLIMSDELDGIKLYLAPGIEKE